MSVAIERVWRDERLQIVATLARRLGDLELAEEAVQDAFATAVVRWPVDGVPDRPGAWLTTTAFRRAIDLRRRAHANVDDIDAHPEIAADDSRPEWIDETDLGVPDDRLRLTLACCHPALAAEARVALTLRHVAGLTSREIAAALLTSEATMDKRLVRARLKIRTARIAFTLPRRDELPARLADVHAVLYLVFTEGYLASADGPAVRLELCDEAIWLARQLLLLVPSDDETRALLALFLLQHARRDARLDTAGHLIPFDRQDRETWDQAAIDEARDLLALTGATPPGPYQLEAAIALLHATVPAEGDTPWTRIAALYAALARLDRSEVITVNRAYAVGRAGDVRAALDLLAPVLESGRLDRYAPLHAVHADLLERDGQRDAAQLAWERAIDTAPHPRQQDELRRHISTRSAAPH